LLHLSVLREYLFIDFAYQQEDKWDLERIIDDFVFMTFLVGNDFLPHMPTLDIGDGAFDLIFGIYKEQRHGWGDGNYLTDSGAISDPSRLEIFLAAIGAVETEILEQREKDEGAYMKKRRRWDKRDGKPDGPSDAELKAVEESKQDDYVSMIESMMAKRRLNELDFVEGWTPVTTPGQKDFKGRYYYEKLKLTPTDIKEHRALRKSYIEGKEWT
jgi:5'-3' exoribonuclease 2